MGENFEIERCYIYPHRKMKIFERFKNFIKYKDVRCLFENCIPLKVIKEIKGE